MCSPVIFLTYIIKVVYSFKPFLYLISIIILAMSDIMSTFVIKIIVQDYEEGIINGVGIAGCGVNGC